MYSLLSDLAYLLIAPQHWILALLVWLLLSNSSKTKKILAAVIVLFVFFFGNSFIYKSIIIARQPKPVTLPAGVTYEAGIVLGGISSFDRYGRGYFNSASDRFIEICILYKTGKIKRIIISGGRNAPGQPKDSQFQYRKMIELGIPIRDIIVEDSSTNTFENAVFSKIKIDSMQLKPPFVLVTSAMHIPRAEKVFTKSGIPVVPFPCDYHVIESNFQFSDYVIPDLGTLLSWNGLLKELAGIVGYKVFKKA